MLFIILLKYTTKQMLTNGLLYYDHRNTYSSRITKVTAAVNMMKKLWKKLVRNLRLHPHYNLWNSLKQRLCKPFLHFMHHLRVFFYSERIFWFCFVGKALKNYPPCQTEHLKESKGVLKLCRFSKRIWKNILKPLLFGNSED